MQNLYNRLATHLEHLTMGYPYTEELIDLLKEMFSPAEAQVALAIPNDLAPLQVVSLENISARTDLPLPAVAEALESMAGRNILFTALPKTDPQAMPCFKWVLVCHKRFSGAEKRMRPPNAWQS